MKIGVFGTGYWGPNIVRNLLALEQDVVVFDTDATRSAAMVRRYPQCHVADSGDQILSDTSISAVAIAVPVQFHADLIVRSLAAGKHVFVEKPLCQTPAELAQIARAMQGTVLMTGHVTSFSAGIRALKRGIHDGWIGNLQHCTLRRTHCGPIYSATDVLTEVAAHDVAILTMLIPTPPASVIASGYSRLQSGQLDAAGLLLEWPDGTTASIEAQWACAIRCRSVIAEGTKGTLEYSLLEDGEHLVLHDQSAAYNALRSKESSGVFARTDQQRRDVVLAAAEPLCQELKTFLSCAASGQEPLTGYAFSAAVVRVLAAARYSLLQASRRVPIA